MSGLDKDRFRNKTVSFRMSPDERRELDARVKISGLAKNQFIIKELLFGEIKITIGKYQSDRLSIEIKRLREQIEVLGSNNELEELNELMRNCEALLKALLAVVSRNEETNNLDTSNFRTVK